jgi:hypothetical protein
MYIACFSFPLCTVKLAKPDFTLSMKMAKSANATTIHVATWGWLEHGSILRLGLPERFGPQSFD